MLWTQCGTEYFLERSVYSVIQVDSSYWAVDSFGGEEFLCHSDNVFLIMAYVEYRQRVGTLNALSYARWLRMEMLDGQTVVNAVVQAAASDMING